MELPQTTVDPLALMARAEALIDQGRPGAARPLIAAVRGLAAPSSGLSVLAARLALSDGTLDEAEDELDAAIAADPTHTGLRKCRAELLRQLGDLDGATRDAAEAVICDRHDPGAKALLGVLLREIGRPADAVACLREAVAAAPNNPAYREALSHARSDTGDLDGALTTLLDGLAGGPAVTDTSTRNAAILLCIRRRDFIRADQLAEAGRLVGSADASTFGLRGHALSSLGRHEDAAAAYDAALKLAPTDALVRQLVTAAGLSGGATQPRNDHLRTLFDGYASRFESHLISLGYRIPGLIRRLVLDFQETTAINGVLDLGCGTGLAALALSDLSLGAFTGIDVSPNMLGEARAKGLYDDLREAELPAALRDETRHWRLIIAADLLCYFGALDEILTTVRPRLKPGGRFLFSVEELVADHDGIVPGDGDWSLGRMGRFAHAADYVTRVAEHLGYRCLSLAREVLRHEGGEPVAGLIVALERPLEDG